MYKKTNNSIVDYLIALGNQPVDYYGRNRYRLVGVSNKTKPLLDIKIPQKKSISLVVPDGKISKFRYEK